MAFSFSEIGSRKGIAIPPGLPSRLYYFVLLIVLVIYTSWRLLDENGVKKAMLKNNSSYVVAEVLPHKEVFPSESCLKCDTVTFESTSFLAWRRCCLFGVDFAASGRSRRFPSVEERILFYMSSWYLPPSAYVDKASQSWWNYSGAKINFSTYQKINDSLYLISGVATKDGDGVATKDGDDASVDQMLVSDEVYPDLVFFLQENNITMLNECIENHPFLGMRVSYCPELLFQMRPLYNAVTQDLPQGTLYPPLFVQVGDASISNALLLREGNSSAANIWRGAQYDMEPRRSFRPTFPLIKRFRVAFPSESSIWQDFILSNSVPRCISSLKDIPVQPIVWQMDGDRHFGSLRKVPSMDIPWGEKHNKTMFRGAMRGNRINGIEDDRQLCLALSRCRLVLLHHDSTLVDAKLTAFKSSPIPSVVSGIPLSSSKVRMDTLLQYKGLVLLEGNDVSSGLKWALLSQSVVLMPPPTKSSWAMEEWLQPYIHYIPLQPDLSDVEQQTQWMLDNDAEAQQISRRASLWMQDLVGTDEASRDNDKIEREMLIRYLRLYRSAS